jgi:hypothetical protein
VGCIKRLEVGQNDLRSSESRVLQSPRKKRSLADLAWATDQDYAVTSVKGQAKIFVSAAPDVELGIQGNGTARWFGLLSWEGR